MKKTFTLIMCFLSLNAVCQVGIGTTSPSNSAALEIHADNKGVLLPRLTTTQRNNITSPANGLLVYNTDTNTLEFNAGSTATPHWTTYLKSCKVVSDDSNNLLHSGTDGGAHLESVFHVGKFRITSTGTIDVSGVPFEPKFVTFTAYTNIENYNIDDDNDANQNNNNGIANVFGSMKGYVKNTSGIIEQQVIYNSGHGNSINDISRFASNNHVIGLRYGNQNGDLLGKTTAQFVSFNSDGFTINVDNFTDGLVVIFEAHR
jgi:hypothetical protein